MRLIDIVRSAVANSFRSKLRTTLTVLAIFIGAFTLTITSGIGTGINAYIASTVAALGADDVLTVTKTAEEAQSDGPREYDPNTVTTGQGPNGQTVETMDQADIDELAGIDGVLEVKPSLRVNTDYVQAGSGTKYEFSVGSAVSGITLQLAAGDQPDETTSQLQVAIPTDLVEPLGFSSPDDAVGQTVTIAVTDAAGLQSTVDATVVAVSEPSLGAMSNATANDALTTALYDLQQVGAPAGSKDTYSQAVVRFDEGATASEVQALKDRLVDAGYTGTTVKDQIGTFTSVIDAIVLVLNGFAIIALLAASFGIVNTLLMSVQERTREIGLMKAMGMGSGRVFTLFSLEAVFIGFLGSAIGAGVAILVGNVLSGVLGRTIFADLSGLSIVSFTPASIATIIVAVMAIAFVAGTLPASRAARQDPIESLRYE